MHLFFGQNSHFRSLYPLHSFKSAKVAAFEKIQRRQKQTKIKQTPKCVFHEGEIKVAFLHLRTLYDYYY